jgi:hypothetical protein
MTTEQIHLERRQDPPAYPVQRAEPAPLFSVAERLALWAHQFGEPATRAEWLAALDAGQIDAPRD